jgi:hypothetical protein
MQVLQMHGRESLRTALRRYLRMDYSPAERLQCPILRPTVLRIAEGVEAAQVVVDRDQQTDLRQESQEEAEGSMNDLEQVTEYRSRVTLGTWLNLAFVIAALACLGAICSGAVWQWMQVGEVR